MNYDPSALDGLIRRGARRADALSPWLSAAHRLSASRLHLCAGLGDLAMFAAVDLGSQPDEALSEAGALLAVLSKVDDDHIDRALFFAEARAWDRPSRAAAAEAYLRPTLASVLRGHPADPSPRCGLAAEAGRRLRALASSPERLAFTHALLRLGWAAQVASVEVLFAPPESIEQEEILRVTADTSGLWLLIIASVGALPAGSRPLTAAEREAFFRVGLVIQAADALADLERELADGMTCTLPMWMLHQICPELTQPRQVARGIWMEDVGGQILDLRAEDPGLVRLPRVSAVICGIYDMLVGRALAKVAELCLGR